MKKRSKHNTRCSGERPPQFYPGEQLFQIKLGTTNHESKSSEYGRPAAYGRDRIRTPRTQVVKNWYAQGVEN